MKVVSGSEQSQLEKEDENKDYGNIIHPNRRNFIIGVPEYHENLYRHLHKWESWFNGTNTTKAIYHKDIKTPEELETLNQIISALRTEKSELFIDRSFHKKPVELPTREYINEFLRIKGIFSYYSFVRWFRATVYPQAGEGAMDLYTDQPLEPGRKMEYIFVPLLIRLKKNKVFDQFKSIHYLNTTSGTDKNIKYEIKPVNPKHFLRDTVVTYNQKEKLQERTGDSSVSKYLVYTDPIPRVSEEDNNEEEEDI